MTTPQVQTRQETDMLDTLLDQYHGALPAQRTPARPQLVTREDRLAAARREAQDRFDRDGLPRGLDVTGGQ